MPIYGISLFGNECVFVRGRHLERGIKKVVLFTCLCLIRKRYRSAARDMLCPNGKTYLIWEV